VSVGHRIAPLFGTVGNLLVRELSSGGWSRFTAIVAFARMSGVAHIEPPLTHFTNSGGRADLTIGTDLRSTSYEAAWYLMHAVHSNGRMLLASAEPGATFHPKVFILTDADPEKADAVTALRAASRAMVIIGSSNFTGGGLFLNDEASLVWIPDLAAQPDQDSWAELLRTVSSWLDPTSTVCLGTATASLLKTEALSGRLPQEIAVQSTQPRRAPASSKATARSRRPPKRPALLGPAPPLLAPTGPKTPPGISVLIARLAFGSSRRWNQWELNTDVLASFFGVVKHGDVIQREAVDQAGVIHAATSTQLVIAMGKNRRLEFQEPDGRSDPFPAQALLVVVDRRPGPFRYTVLLASDPPYAAVDALNRASPALGRHIPTTKRVVVTMADLLRAWPGCPL
jgi:HKD family nuclease